MNRFKKIELNKEILIISVVLLVGASFSYGLMVSHYKLFPFDQLKILKNDITVSKEPSTKNF